MRCLIRSVDAISTFSGVVFVEGVSLSLQKSGWDYGTRLTLSCKQCYLKHICIKISPAAAKVA